MSTVFLNVILIIFPVLCHFLYMVYSKTTLKDENFLFFDLMLLSSVYLYYRFGIESKYCAILVSFTLFLAIYKKRFFSGILLVCCFSFIYNSLYGINIYVLLFVFLSTFLIGYYKKINTKLLCPILSVIILILIMVFSNMSINFVVLIKLLLLLSLNFLFYIMICNVYDKIESMVNVYLSLEDTLKEKKLYESLFKITHEIKNPLAVCKGYLDMFDSRDEKKASRYASIISQEIDRTLILLNDFSNVSKMKIDKKKMDITLLCEDVCDEVSPIFDNNIKFDFNIPDEEVFINGDYNRLKQVLINVIKNSKESIDKKGRVSVSTKRKLGGYYIEIKDTGCGMDSETINKIGSAFYTTKKNGTGLGVCLSKEIIDRHEGIIDYKSKVGVGTTCLIKFPIIKVS